MRTIPDVRTAHQTKDRPYANLRALIYLLFLSLLLLPTAAFAQDKSGVKPSVISLPSGPGSLEGLGESFEPDLSTGTSSFPVKFLAVPGRVGFQPELTLDYNGGFANSAWGMGWRLSIASIQRRTDDGIPTYDDAQDTFIYMGGEKLVRLNNGDYRFENESSFMRLRRIAASDAPNQVYWEAHTPDGMRYLFGETAQARVTNERGIFRWELERMIDTHGNEMRYIYLHDGGHAYPQEIRYNFGGHQGGPSAASGAANDNNIYNAVVFNYEPRPDTYTDRRSGAPIRVGLRGTNIEMWSLGKLVRAYAFTYEPERSTGTYSLLTSVTQVGDDGESTLPPHTFTYTQFDPTAYEVVPMQNPPPVNLLNPDADLISIRCNGLTDILHTTESGEHRFYINLGNGRWDPNPVIPQNSPAERLSNPNVRMGDFNSDGCPDFLVKAGNTPGSPFYYYANRGDGEWQREDRVDMGDAPAFDLNSRNIEFNDYDNDGDADVGLMTDGRLKIWLARAGGWSDQADFDVAAPAAGGAVKFSDAGLFIMDMDGDNVTDLAFVRDGRIVVWSHNGNGNYDEPTPLRNAPTGVGDGTLRMGDFNNDGKADVLLIGNRTITYWLNLGDGSLSEPITLQDTPAYSAESTAIRMADINGDGADEVVFSSNEGMTYVDFSTGPQPFLLKSVNNGLGRTIHVTYKSSIEDYIADQDAGKPWEIDLPFPVQVVNRVTVNDANSGDNYTVDYHYRDGYYNGEQKEFRGFVRSQEIKVGDATAATTVTENVFDVGMVDEARKGLVLESAVLSDSGECAADFSGCYERTVNQLETRVVVDAAETGTGKPIAYAFVKQADTFVHEQTAAPVHLRQTFQQDKYGNQTEHFNYGIVCGTDVNGGDVACGDDELLTYTAYIYDEERYIFDRPQRIHQTDENGAFVSDTRMYYDGEDYVGLPLGQLTRGNLTRQEQNLGPNGDNRFVATTRQAFDEYGNVVGMMDGNGNRITVAFDAQMHTFPVTERMHLGDGQTLTYAASYHYGFGQVTSATDYNGNAHLFTYDAFGRITKMAYPGDTLAHPTKEFRYEIGSPRSAITTILREESGTDNVRISVDYYDGLGRKLQTRTEAEGGRVVVDQAMTFNARQGEQRTFLPYYGSSLEYAAPEPTLPHVLRHYDPLERVVKTVNPDGTFTTVVHEPLIQKQFDEADNTPGSPHANTPLTLKYDGLERLLSVHEINVVDGQREQYDTVYTHDLLGNLTQVVDAQNNIKTMRYDALSRLVYMDDPDRGETSYTFDDANNLIRTVDAKGQIIHQHYDGANRLALEQWEAANGTRKTAFTYHYDSDLSAAHPAAQNTLGRMAYIEYPGGADYMSYDARGNVTGRIRHFTEDDLTFVTQLTYDAMDRLTTVTFPNGYTIDYGYNAQGLLKRIPGYINDIAYTAFGQRDVATYANNVATKYGYDANQRVNALRSTSGSGTVLHDLTYAHDPVGNIVRIADDRPDRVPENDQNQTFQYDNLYRLTQAVGTYGTIDYGYSSIGNLVRKTTDVAEPQLNLGELRYGENGAGPHAPTTVGTVSYGYDANGNLRQRGDMVMTWDARNRMVGATVGTLEASYLYGSGAARVRQVVKDGDTETTTYYIDDYAELRDGQLIFYVFDDKTRVAQITTPFDKTQLLTSFDDSPADLNPTVSTPQWYVADHLGGTNLLVSNGGAIVSDIAYYPYGLPRHTQNGDATAYHYTGQEYDKAIGLYNYVARLYDPVSASFASVDPLFAASPDKAMATPQAFNTYAYVGGNPLNYTDPSGLLKANLDTKLGNDSTFTKGAARFDETKEGQRLMSSLETLSDDVTLNVMHIDTFAKMGGDISVLQDRTGFATVIDRGNGKTEALVVINPDIIDKLVDAYDESTSLTDDQYLQVLTDRYAETIEHELLHIENKLVTGAGAGRFVSQKIKDAGINGDLADAIGGIVADTITHHLNEEMDKYQRPSLHPRLETFQREVGTLRPGLR